ncbi:uncharacterized protein PGRI_036360 [Penicillium griseofulvum]|uniref:non-specific serine/threonine protein kinase n=1 Tax=Penicillium patulum TaxID=5078 RepID=A0A135LDC4_PENPA|nr:uncharacterized protein PGRI_036360 [Penicillium griseofulvum]KXG46890.1 hypothetical protein PGRI_036360 [Penicillium griseofulvum]
MSQVSDLVRDSKLPTKLDADLTTHTFLESTLVAGRRGRRREREEVWKKKRDLGIGIFGTTWLEECVSQGKLRAVKEVRKLVPGSRSMDYNRELEAIARFSQQKYDGCFVKSSGWFENTECLFIAMEYFPLGDLQKYMTQLFREREAQQITFQLLEGLDFMHASGFAHGDLKPQNVFVLSTGPDWWVKIGDFGISKRVMEGFTGIQTFNSMPAFTAPEVYEQLWGSSPESTMSGSDSSSEIDIWGLGVITYYLLTGRFPFSGKTDLLEYYKGNSILPFDSSHSPVSPEATSFLSSMMAPNPADRPTARDALDYAWLIPMLQDDPQPHSPDQPTTATQDPVEAASKSQTSSATQDVLLPGKIDLTPDVPKKHTLRTELAQQMQNSLCIDGDTYKQIVDAVNNAKPTSTRATMTNSVQIHNGHPPTDTHSIALSQSSDLQSIEAAHHTTQPQNIAEEFPNLPSYNRRRSDAAPIPISELSYVAPAPGSPTSRSTSTSTRNGSDRFSEKIRRASRNIMPKPNRFSQDHGPTSPISPNSSSSTRSQKSQSIEIPHRPQFAEGLPLFPIRTDKKLKDRGQESK